MNLFTKTCENDFISPAAAVVGHRLVLLWRFGFRFGFEIVDQSAPHTLDAVYMPLTRPHVLLHVVNHSLRSIQSFTLTN